VCSFRLCLCLRLGGRMDDNVCKRSRHQRLVSRDFPFPCQALALQCTPIVSTTSALPNNFQFHSARPQCTPRPSAGCMSQCASVHHKRRLCSDVRTHDRICLIIAMRVHLGSSSVGIHFFLNSRQVHHQLELSFVCPLDLHSLTHPSTHPPIHSPTHSSDRLSTDARAQSNWNSHTPIRTRARTPARRDEDRMQDDSGDSSSGNNDDGGRGGGLKEEGATKGGAGSITSEMASLRLSRRVDIVRCSLTASFVCFLLRSL
jgi:hypothetical protein